MYREEEKEKVPFKEKMKQKKDFAKLDRATGVHNRKKIIKELTEKIPTANDLGELLAMKEDIARLDLDDPRRGKVLDENLIKMLNEKIAKAQPQSEEGQEREF